MNPPGGPKWGVSDEDREGITHHIACCLVKNAPPSISQVQLMMNCIPNDTDQNGLIVKTAGLLLRQTWVCVVSIMFYAPEGSGGGPLIT